MRFVALDRLAVTAVSGPCTHGRRDTGGKPLRAKESIDMERTSESVLNCHRHDGTTRIDVLHETTMRRQR
jgi:hypothetical protein